MGIVLDIILVLILLISIFMGYKKGLVNVAFNILAFLMALEALILNATQTAMLPTKIPIIRDKMGNKILSI